VHDKKKKINESEGLRAVIMSSVLARDLKSRANYTAVEDSDSCAFLHLETKKQEIMYK
jgi:hypothetical protein